MKTHARVTRKDSLQNHIHAIKGSTDTEGQLTKPSQSTEFPTHTHLYMWEGKVHETGPAPDEPGHTHELSTRGLESGPKKPFPTQESFGPRNDSIVRIGCKFHFRRNGKTVARGDSAEEVAMDQDNSDMYDEAIAKRAIDMKDDETWEKAKNHSQAALGKHNWAYVQHTYHLMGGK